MPFKEILLAVFFPLIFQPSPATSQAASLHKPWNDLLKQYVNATGTVNYKGLKKDEAKLDAYLRSLASNPMADSRSRNEQMAFWINAYNAFTVKVILTHYPVKSIKDIEGGKIWDKPFITIGGRTYSLNNIEHDVLRKKFSDPRIHFAVNCASISCPKLLNEAFTADKLEVQLNRTASEFINDPTKNVISPSALRISSIFDWYKSDFTGQGTLIEYLNKFATQKISANASISYLSYDWSLNE